MNGSENAAKICVQPAPLRVLVGAPFEEWIYSSGAGYNIEWDFEGRAYLFKQ